MDAPVRQPRSAGRHRWTRQFEGVEQDNAVGLGVDREGNVIVGGTTSGDLKGQGKGQDGWARKYGT